MALESHESGGSDVRQTVLSVVSAVVVILLALFVGSLIAQLVAGALVAVGVPLKSTPNYVARSVFQFVGFGIAVAAYLSLADAWSILRLHAPVLRDFGWAFVGVIALLVLSTGASLVLSSFDVVPAQNQVIAMGRQNPALFLYMIPVTLFFVGPFEELVFRGAAQGFLRRALGPTLAVAVASALFGAVHLIALIGGGGTGQLAYVGIAALLGVVLGSIYEHTGNLLVPIVVHGVYNATLFAIQWVNATGGAGAPL